MKRYEGIHTIQKPYSPSKVAYVKQHLCLDKVGDNLEFIFPEFSESRMVTISPDIFELPKTSLQPAFDLIIGIETMTKLGVVLNFDDKMITMDQQTLPMRTFESISNLKQLRS